MRRLIALGLLAVLTAGCAGQAPGGSGPDAPRPTGSAAATVPPLHPSIDGYPQSRIALERPDGSVIRRLAVKAADTLRRRQHGLMEVASLPAGTGMLFVFDRTRSGGFWMKNTHVPLSIAYVDRRGVIVDVLDMQPCPEPEPSGGCPVYTPREAYVLALEVPQGWFEEIGVAPGDRLRVLSGPGSTKAT